MAKNLFLVNSSINLLSTFVLANSMFEEDENYLALVHPHGYERWQEDPILRFISSPEAGFTKVFTLIDKVFSSQLDYIKKEMKIISFDNVFCGNDCGVQNQLLMSALGIKNFYRLDDGLGSYYKATKRSFLRALLHKIKFYAIALPLGLIPNFEVNTVAMGESKSAVGDYLFMPELLQRYSPKVVEITTESVQKAMYKLKEKGFLAEEFLKEEYIIYLSEPITEIKSFDFDFDDEIKIIEILLKHLGTEYKFIYKPHPNDKPYKIDYIKSNFKDIVVYENRLPVEFLLYKEKNIKKVVSYFCSTLIFAKKISNPDVKCVSLAKLANVQIDSTYLELMEKSGVEFKL